jgi:hypothetical protein
MLLDGGYKSRYPATPSSVVEREVSFRSNLGSPLVKLLGWDTVGNENRFLAGCGTEPLPELICCIPSALFTLTCTSGCRVFRILQTVFDFISESSGTDRLLQSDLQHQQYR